jgi:hypothetical protein
MNQTKNEHEEQAASIIPALLTGVVATYLGLTSKGALLKDIATESVSRAVYGQIKNNKRPSNKHRRNRHKNKGSKQNK